MRRDVVRNAIIVGGLLAAIGAGWAGCHSSSDDVTRVESALTTTFTLPVVVGLSPSDIVLGATGIVTVNGGGGVGKLAGAENVIVALGTTGTTTIGLNANIGKIWSRPNLSLQAPQLTFYKTQGTVQIQNGTIYADPDENRTSQTIRQDPTWTVQLTAPDTGTAVTVLSGQTRSLAPGNYGATTVSGGGTLILTGGGNYGFVSLNLQASSVVQFASPTTTFVFVNSSLTVRSPLGGAGLIFAYLGTSAVQLESGFTGDLFLAPNADVNVLAQSTARFFAKNITVAQNRFVIAPLLSARSQLFLRPTETVVVKGVFGNGLMQEIAAAVMTPSNTPSCTEPTAFITYQGGNLVYQKFSDMGKFIPGTLVGGLTYPVPPGGCFGPNLAFPAIPENQAWPWQVLPGGIPEYSDVGTLTDNTMLRLDGGRAISVGFSLRYCDDPNPGSTDADCPATQPAEGQACNGALVTGKCVYGTTPATWCDCPSSRNTFSCTRLRRLEEGTLGLRMTSDCGATWTTGQFDPFVAGAQQAGRDRPESYFDPFDKKLYVSMLLAGEGHNGTNQNIVYVASTAGVTNASQFTFQRALPDKPFDGTPEVMTTVLDERARLTSTSFGRWVHLATARCPISPEGKARVVFVPPSGTPQEIALENTSDPTTGCHNLGLGFANILYGPSIVGISSAPPRLYVAYVGTSSTGKGLINVWAITLKSAQGYAGPHVVQRVLTLQDTSHHYFYPQLIRVDGRSGSDLLVDTPVILRYTTWDGADTVEERAVPLYSGLSGGSKLIASWSVAKACGSSTPCFAGDYRYGSFVSKTNGKLLFFTPWSGQGKGSPPPVGVFAQGATIEVTP